MAVRTLFPLHLTRCMRKSSQSFRNVSLPAYNRILSPKLAYYINDHQRYSRYLGISNDTGSSTDNTDPKDTSSGSAIDTSSVTEEYMSPEIQELNRKYMLPVLPEKIQRYVPKIRAKAGRDIFPPPEEELENFIQTAGCGDILALVKAQGKQLSGYHLFHCIKRLKDIPRFIEQQEVSDQYAGDLSAVPEFHILCALVARRSNMFGPKMTLETLQIMQKLNLDSTSSPMMVVLQLMKHHLSDLSPDQVIALGQVVSSLTQTQQTETILAGASLWLQENLKKHHIEFLTFGEVLHLLLLFGVELSDDIVQTAFRHLYQSDVLFGHKIALKIKKLLLQLEYNHPNLEQKCRNKILRAQNRLEPSEIFPLFQEYANLKRNLHWADAHLVAALFESLQQADLRLPELLQALDFSSHLSYLDEKLLTRLNSALFWQDERLTEEQVGTFLTVLTNTWHILNLSQECMSAIKTVLEKSRDDSATESEQKTQVNQILDFLTERDSPGVTSHPGLQRSPICHDHPVLAGALDKVFKDEVVEHGVHSENGILIDHLIQLQGQQEDSPPCRVAVLEALWTDIFLYSGHTRGPLVAQMYSLTQEGYRVVTVNIGYWRRLKDEEKLIYLRRAIASAAERQPDISRIDVSV